MRRYNIGGHNEKQNIEIIHIILDTLQEMLPDGDPRKELVSDKLITYVDRPGKDMTVVMPLHRTRSKQRSAGIRRPCSRTVFVGPFSGSLRYYEMKKNQNKLEFTDKILGGKYDSKI